MYSPAGKTGRAKLPNGDKAGSVEDMKQALQLNPNENEKITGQFDNQSESAINVLGL